MGLAAGNWVGQRGSVSGSKGRESASTEDRWGLFPRQYTCAGQNRSCRPSRICSRHIGRTCDCFLRHRRLLAVLMWWWWLVLGMSQRCWRLLSSRCVYPLSCVFLLICIPNLAHNPFQFSRHIVQNPFPRFFHCFWGFLGFLGFSGFWHVATHIHRIECQFRVTAYLGLFLPLF